MKVSEATGVSLDWMVAKCEGNEIAIRKGYLWIPTERYSTDWSQGGPIIEREKIGSLWEARNVWSASTKWYDPSEVFYGKTKLIAAMRCYVASKLGEEVEVPEGL